jgi:hypothetical protein
MPAPPWRTLVGPLDMAIAAVALMFALGSGFIDGGHAETGPHAETEPLVSAISAGRIVAEWPLADVGSVRRDSVAGAYGRTVLETSGGGVRVVASSCPRGWCRQHGRPTMAGGLIVCAPNRLVVTVGTPNPSGTVDAITQ